MQSRLLKFTNNSPTPLKMKINKISKKLIKPHTPTPQNLKNYTISFIDQFTGPLNFAVILFYQSKLENDSRFEESLAKTLIDFYPFAGRYIKNDHIIDCSDQGVEFIETEAPAIELAALVARIETDQLNALLPEPYFRVDEGADDPLLSIQITNFSCGGLAVAMSISHRVFDVSSLGTFVAAWSNATNLYQTVGNGMSPTFSIPSLLPYKNLDLGDSDQFSIKSDEKIVVRRFSFDKRALTRLAEGKKVSGVRVMCAVIAKALIRLDREKQGRSRNFVVAQPVNMRGRTNPPQPDNVCGNFIFTALTRRVGPAEGEGIEIHALVDLIGDSIRGSIGQIVEILSPNRDGRDLVMNSIGNFVKEVIDPDTNVMVFTDWSRFGFYEADFGSGKPVWTSIGPQRPPFPGFTVLMSYREGDGIEAWVHLNENDMRCFEQDEDIIRNVCAFF